MTSSDESEELPAARFVGADLSGVVMRGVDVQGADIDGPWLAEEGGSLVVNGVDVVPLVEAELDRRYPGRGQRRAPDPDGLRAAWAAIERTWAATLERVAAMSAGTVDVSVGGEWSFAQTLRHLVMATDVWLGRAVLGLAQPYHPLGQPYAEFQTDGHDMPSSPREFRRTTRCSRLAQIGSRRCATFLATVTPSDLSGLRRSPWDPDHEKTVLGCLNVILGEEWEHYRYAVRDLDVLAAGSRQG